MEWVRWRNCLTSDLKMSVLKSIGLALWLRVGASVSLWTRGLRFDSCLQLAEAANQ